jgi:hypothetical protein
MAYTVSIGKKTLHFLIIYLFFIRSEGFNTQEPAHQFAGELQGEVVDFVN